MKNILILFSIIFSLKTEKLGNHETFTYYPDKLNYLIMSKNDEIQILVFEYNFYYDLVDFIYN